MNCKPGDLAVIVNGGKYHAEHLGKLVRLTAPGIVNEWGPTWEYEGTLWSTRFKQRVPYIEDIALRPVRPGDITDEEVRDLYAPKQPEAA